MSDPATPVPPLAPLPHGKVPPGAVSAPALPRPAAPMPAARRPFVVLTALAFAMVIVGMVLLWQRHMQLEESSATRTDVGALREQVRSLQQRITQLELRITQLDQRPAPLTAQSVDVRPLEARLSALEQRPAAIADADPALAGRVAALDLRLLQAEQQGARTARLARLQRAALALEAGQVLGEIPGAPAALARHAATPPPTEAALRLAFADAASRARAASSGDAGAGIVDRVWARLRGLVTVREGDAVLVGSPAAVVLGHAAQRLAAGDLAGSVAALDALDPGAAAVMAGWRRDAAGLLAARVALAEMFSRASAAATAAE